MPDPTDLEERTRARRQLRDQVLLGIYEATDGLVLPRGRVNIETVPFPDEIEENELDAAFQYLVAAGYVEQVTNVHAGLTADGLEAAEALLLPPDDPLEVVSVTEGRRLEAYTDQVRRDVEQGNVEAPEEVLQEIRDLLLMMQTQLGRTPRKGVVWSMLRVLRSLLLGSGGSAGWDLAKQAGEVLG